MERTDDICGDFSLYPFSFFIISFSSRIFPALPREMPRKKRSDVATKMHPGCEEQEKDPLDPLEVNVKDSRGKRKRDGGA